MKFKTKLYIGFGTQLIFVVLFISIIVSMFQDMNQNTNEVVKLRYKMVQLSSDIRSEISNVDRSLINLVLSKENENIQPKIELIKNIQIKKDHAMDTLHSLLYIEKSKEQFSKVRVLDQSYHEIQLQVISLLLKGQKEEARVIMLEGALQNRLELFEEIDSFKIMQENNMEETLEASKQSYEEGVETLSIVIAVSILLELLIISLIIRSISQSLNKIRSVMGNVHTWSAEELPRVDIKVMDEIGEIGRAFNEMAATLEEHTKEEKKYLGNIQEQSWLESKIAEFASMTQGINNLGNLSNILISRLASSVGASLGIFYIKEVLLDTIYTKYGSYADITCYDISPQFRLGEGLIGQCARDRKEITISDIPDNYFQITSGLGTSKPNYIIILPVEYQEEVLAVVELASIHPFSSLQITMMRKVLNNIGIVIHNIQDNLQVEKLLKESQILTEELQSQSEELQLQQEELKSMNERLEEQYKSSEQKSKELEKVKENLEKNAEELILSSQYKSEFLANMSHELRTPLNSLLILTSILAENADQNLNSKQLEYIHTIHSSGNELLQLINEILDLSKVESGKMLMHFDTVSIHNLKQYAIQHFSLIAEKKGIQFLVHIEEGTSEKIWTDEKRLQQVIKNLLSNAFKFTSEGMVSLMFTTKVQDSHSLLAISVQDTGIGIPEEKLHLIFEAFQQADGTTSRNYGGTGLGLTISREIALLLNGYIEVESTEGFGSIFTLYLPYNMMEQHRIQREDSRKEELFTIPELLLNEGQQIATTSKVEDEEENILSGKKVLVVDDDMRNIFALTTALESNGVTVFFAENGGECLQMLENETNPDLILMDIMMPGLDGYETMKEIRKSERFRSVPIIAVTAKAMKNDREKCLDAGASDYISKPVNLKQLISLLQVWLYK